MALRDETHAFLARAGGNVVNATAYDTAWVAALRADSGGAGVGTPRFPAAREWLSANQHDDGSWGAPWPYYHDRLLSTLRAVLTLHTWGRRAADQRRIERGLSYIWRNAGRLAQDPWETVGFELIFPTLLAQAEQQGLVLPYAAFQPVQRLRELKLARAPRHLAYQRTLPLGASLELLGAAFSPAQAADLQESDGGVATSPSATAYLLAHWPGNAAAAGYLARVLRESGAEGGVPAFFPMETLERAWALYQLQQAVPNLHTLLPGVTRPLLDFLAATRAPDGWTASCHSSVRESDTTGVCFAVLHRAGYDLDPHLLYQYEEADHFRCYPLERNPSISANVHILDALRFCPAGERAPRVEKILRFLAAVRQPGGFWFDKWHVSPYYTTSHVVLAAHDLAPALVESAADWMIQTQWDEGGWGYFAPTAEETAYALLALARWREAGRPVPSAVLARGAAYLRQHYVRGRTAYPSLWIGKTLYTPVQVVQAAVLAALWCCERCG